MRVAFVILTTLAAAACIAKRPSTTLKHDMGRALSDEFPYQWVDVSDDEYFEILNRESTTYNKEKALFSDHPATQRLQFWLDAFDTMLRSREGKRFDAIPKPRAKLVLSERPNAFVSPVDVCLNIEAVFEGHEFDQQVGDVLRFDRLSRDFSTASDRSECLASTLPKDKQLEILKWHLGVIEDCHVTVEDEMAILSKGCAEGADLENHRFKAVSVNAVSNQLTFHSQLFSALSEDELVSVIAHELGHYYMAHALAAPGMYGFFYRLSSANPHQKPKSDSEAETLGKMLMETFRDKVYFDEPVEGQKYASFVFFFLRNLVFNLERNECGEEQNCAKPCARLKDFFDDEAKKAAFEGFPSAKLPPGAIGLYQEYEKLASECSRIAVISQTQTPGTLSIKGLESNLDSTNQRLARKLVPLPHEKTLAGLLDYLTQAAKNIEADQKAKMRAILQETIDFNLNIYTEEQEADDLALEWLHTLGLAPKAAAMAMIKLSKNFQSIRQPVYGEITQERCERLYQNDWRDETGKDMIIPVADWQDSHHSFCFRIFNIDREIKIHGLSSVAEKQRPQPAGPAWEDIASVIKRLTPSAPMDPIGESGTNGQWLP